MRIEYYIELNVSLSLSLYIFKRRLVKRDEKRDTIGGMMLLF